MYGQVIKDREYLQQVVAAVWAELQRLKVNTVLIMGASGLAPASVLSALHGVRIRYVRKENEATHGYSETPAAGERYVILDDFIASGATMDRLLSFVKGIQQPEAIILYSSSLTDSYKGIPVIGLGLQP